MLIYDTLATTSLQRIEEWLPKIIYFYSPEFQNLFRRKKNILKENAHSKSFISMNKAHAYRYHRHHDDNRIIGRSP